MRGRVGRRAVAPRGAVLVAVDRVASAARAGCTGAPARPAQGRSARRGERAVAPPRRARGGRVREGAQGDRGVDMSVQRRGDDRDGRRVGRRARVGERGGGLRDADAHPPPARLEGVRESATAPPSTRVESGRRRLARRSSSLPQTITGKQAARSDRRGWSRIAGQRSRRTLPSGWLRPVPRASGANAAVQCGKAAGFGGIGPTPVWPDLARGRCGPSAAVLRSFRSSAAPAHR